jgi:hypothetical protein
MQKRPSIVKFTVNGPAEKTRREVSSGKSFSLLIRTTLAQFDRSQQPRAVSLSSRAPLSLHLGDGVKLEKLNPGVPQSVER